MVIQKLLFASIFAVGVVGITSAPAQAHRPINPRPAACLDHLHSKVGKAKKMSTAKQRARKKFDREVGKRWGTFGGVSWAGAKEKHYDCTKKGNWFHCRAAGYPC